MPGKAKRNLSPPAPAGGNVGDLDDDPAASKRARVEDDRALVSAGNGNGGSQKRHPTNGGVPRTSSLAAPTMRLTGHVGEVFAAAFSSSNDDGGDDYSVLLASGGYDRSVLLWRASGECDNVAALQGHKNAVLSLAWLGGGGSFGPTAETVLLSASADGTARAWSVERGAQIKKAAEHGKSVVNCVAAASGLGAPPIFVTAGDDGVAVRRKEKEVFVFLFVLRRRSRKKSHSLFSLSLFPFLKTTIHRGSGTCACADLSRASARSKRTRRKTNPSTTKTTTTKTTTTTTKRSRGDGNGGGGSSSGGGGGRPRGVSRC
jgi:WD40 repeat protein